MSKGWSYITGKKGVNRVRVYTRKDGDPIYIEWFGDGRRWQRSLGLLVGKSVVLKRDAVRYAHQLAEKLATGGTTAVTDIMMQRHAAEGREDALTERLTLPTDELLAHELPAKNLCGIYFLMDRDGEVIYVGQSENILTRISRHLQQSPEAIARIAYQLFDVADLDRVEAFYIHRFQPPDNVKYPPLKADDKELLKSFAVGALPTPQEDET